MRKDVERAFGVLQARFAIIKWPARLWDFIDLKAIMQTCIILHNKIVENERGQDLGTDYHMHSFHGQAYPDMNDPEAFAALVSRLVALKDSDTHNQLKKDLIEHHWQRQGNM